MRTGRQRRRFAVLQSRQGQFEMRQGITVATNDALVYFDALGQHRQFERRRRSSRIPLHQARHGEHGLVEFDARDHQGAVAGERAPGQRNFRALRRQENAAGDRVAHAQVRQQQSRFRAKRVFGFAFEGKFELQGLAGLRQYRRRQAVRFELPVHPPPADEQQQHQRRQCDQPAAGATGRGPLCLRGTHRHHSPSEAGSSASTKASRSKMRRSSGFSPRPM